MGGMRDADRMPSDAELVDRTRGGDGAAFGAVYERRRGLVLAFLVKRTGDPELSMDLMAETFAAALLALRDDSLRIDDSAAPWLLTIARNKLIDSYRRGRVEDAARRELSLAPSRISDRDVEQVIELAAEADLLSTLQRELPPDQLAALRARVLDERAYEDIAGELQCSQAVVRKRVSRAIATLRNVLEASA
jgi:RNA polymerase sigma factor (sigma-70 family)